ncbi:Uncharacterised protein [uncultured archaeon]|nr:Uncharacterised protein [uncultured archaeon]
MKIILKNSSHYYKEISSTAAMNLRCNICSQDIDEKEIENHVSSKQHEENKSKISGTNPKGSDNSVVKMWLKSLHD